MSRLVLGLLPKLTRVIPVLRVASPLLYHAWSWHCSFYCIFWWKISRTYMAESSVSAWGRWKWKHTWLFGQWRDISDALDSGDLFLVLWTVEIYFWCFGQWRDISDALDSGELFLVLWTVESYFWYCGWWGAISDSLDSGNNTSNHPTKFSPN